MSAILLVDDNLLLREVLETALVRRGHDVFTAANGKVAMDLLRQHPIDLVISDIVMPEQDGLETLQLARKAYPKLRFILISGDSPRYAELYLKMAAQLGAHKTLMKPFPLATLDAAVDEVLRGSAS